MHWITRICKNSSRVNQKRLFGVKRYEDRRLFHGKNGIFSATPAGAGYRTVRREISSRGVVDNKSSGEDGNGAALGKEHEDPDPDGDSIVISGISGRFPITDSMKELKYHLYNGIDMITPHTRWSTANPRMPKRMGAMKNMDKFDAEFFGINLTHAEVMDPQQRRLHEVVFETIFDAGINPGTLSGSKTGVYIGTLGGEASDFWLARGDYEEHAGYKILGTPNFLQANRISYALNLKGPSMSINSGCSSSLVALEAAIHAMREGACSRAIVAGTTIHCAPVGFIELSTLDALSQQGICRAFDNDADGFVRSEGVVAVLIQKKRDARRNYATIRGIKSACDGYKREGLTFPSGTNQEILLRDTYRESGIDPGQVTYFEAHGTGTPAGDPQELHAIAQVMCKAPSRTQPLLVGSIKSNLGHPESAAGLISVAKVLISIQEGSIAANLNYKTPNAYVKDIFTDGSIKIIDEHTPWAGGLVGVSSFGLGGSIIHMILEPGPRTNPQNAAIQIKAEEKGVPILIPFSGRTKEKVEESLQEISELGTNVEAAGLLHQVFSTNIVNNDYRGYTILVRGEEEGGAEPPVIKVDKCESTQKRPLWFIFPGMGSQWNEMGKDLMKIEAYAESIQKSQVTMKNAGLDLNHLLRPNNPTIFDNIRDSLVAITAVQIALYDTLTSMGLTPDGFLGHSSGEILCAYADGCLSGEEALLVGDARGRAFHESASIQGGMASVGLSWENAQARCPPGVFAACHNAAENVTVSGPIEDIQKFAETLQAEGIFARLVNSCNCAPHSQYVLPAGDLLFKYMNEIYQDERPRTSRWVSSSIPEARWDSPLAMSSSPAYHVNNMSSPVLFHEAVLKVPNNSVVVEIAPRGLFQPILRESLPLDCTLIAPMHHSVEDKVHFFLSAVGKMHNAGVDVDVGKLYPAVNFPVSSTTPMTSSLLKWNHEKSWLLPYLANPTKVMGMTFAVDIMDVKNMFLSGHKLDSRCVFPATGYIVQAWTACAEAAQSNQSIFPVIFEDISLERATFLKEGKPVLLRYGNLTGTGKFVIEEEDVPVIRGSIRSSPHVEKHMFKLRPVEIPQNPETKSLNTDDVYKEFRLRGYNYTGEFRGIQNIDNKGTWAQVAWRGNWTSFLDTLLQTTVLSVMNRATAVPIRIKSIIIDPVKFHDFVKSQQEASEASETEGKSKKDVLIPVSIYPKLKTIQCPGIELRGLTAMVIPRQKQNQTLSVENYSFTPYFDDKTASAGPGSNNSLTSVFFSHVAGLLDLVLENTTTFQLKVIDVFENAQNSLTGNISNIIDLKPRHQVNISMLSTDTELEKLEDKVKNMASSITAKEAGAKLLPDSAFVDLVVLDEPSKLKAISELLQEHGYIILRSADPESESKVPTALQRISEKWSPEATLTLFRKMPSNALPIEVKSAVCIDADNFDFLPELQAAMAEAVSAPPNSNSNSNSRLYLYSQNDPHSGIVGLAKCLRYEPGGDKIRCIFDPNGSLEMNFKTPGKELARIISQDLVINVVKKGLVGSYRHIPMSQDASEPTKQVTHAYVNTLTSGDLTSLRWVESTLTQHDLVRDKDKGQVCTVHYAALNFRDIMLATGKLPVDSNTSYNPQDCVFGFEFAGVDQDENRVMGVMSSKAMASSVLMNPDECLKWNIPDKWSLQEAATVPVVYATAYYALFNRAGLLPGQSILIHSGTGGVGQAAINIALDLNCEVYTTVGTDEKRQHIKELFPTLKDENIANSRDTSFEAQILELTDGRGVDIVLNSLADDKLQASVRCVAVHGKFLEIGAFDAFQNSTLGMECFLKNIELHGVFLNHFLSGSPAEKEEFGRHFLDGIARGVVKPLAHTVFPKDQIEEAFRFMAGGKHMGKVLIEVLPEDQVGQKPSLMAVPRSYFSPDKSYVIIGGLGGMGLELANWLVDRGARHLILTSRSGVTTGYQELCLRKWADRSVLVETQKLDLSSYDVAETLIRKLTCEGKELGGIFNSGLVLIDAPIEEQTQEDFEAVAAPKTVVTKNLDKLTRQYCKQGLDYFVVFSSMACGRGNAGQSNYGLANSVMERICEARKEDGLHGLAIQWGIIGEVGAVAEGIFGAKLTGEEVFDGTFAQRIASCLDVLDMTLHREAATVSSMVLADDDSMKSKKAGLLATIGHICGIKDISSIPPTTKLIELGMDSLIGMEIKQLIERDYNVPLTANEIRTMTFNDLLMIEAGTYVKGQSSGSGSGSGSGQGSSQEAESALLMQLIAPATEKVSRMKSVLSAEEKVEGNLFVLPGIEGNTATLRPLSQKLNTHVFGLNYIQESGADGGKGSVELIARDFIKGIKEIQPAGPYNILAYSACTSIAYEMAVALETECGDKVENLIVLDGTANWRDANVSEQGDFIKRLTAVLTASLNLSIDEHNKLEEAMASDPGNVQVYTEFLKLKHPNVDDTLISGFFDRANALFYMLIEYRPSSKLNGKTTLIKTKDKVHFMAAMNDELHHFGKYCNTPVTAHTVDGDHMSFLTVEKVGETADIINELLLS